MTIWLTGLSASGKTTLANGLAADLTDRGFVNIELLDGEVLRDRLREFGYSTDDRNALGLCKARIARELNERGKVVVVTGIAHHRETREKIRRFIDRYVEVYLKCDTAICAARDCKGHYTKALAGEYDHFVGVTEPYQESSEVELVLETGCLPVQECARLLLEFVLTTIDAHGRQDG